MKKDTNTSSDGEIPVKVHPYVQFCGPRRPFSLNINQHSLPGSKIPFEFHSRILEQIHDKATLLLMLLSSKNIYSEVKRKLYCIIKCNDTTTHTLVLKAILDPKRTRPSRLVHRYYLYKASVYDAGFTIFLERVLPTLTNLKHLSFWGASGLPSAEVLPTEFPCSFQLHTFLWLREIQEPYTTKFLHTQHSPVVLSIFSERMEFPISSTALPNLRNLGGSIEVILEILPGRDKIARLHWD
jgi:hypothetical protein